MTDAAAFLAAIRAHPADRVCERMHELSVFSDDYWDPDGSRYDPVFRSCWPDDWRVIREFTERRHSLPRARCRARFGWVRRLT